METDRTLYQLDAKTARCVILSLQGLMAPCHRRQTLDDLEALIEKLGFVQVDSIQWVERAHHMILHARNQTYRPSDLHVLSEKRQTLFENWTHDSSFIPSVFYPYWRHKFRRARERLTEKFVNWQGDGFQTEQKALLTRIRNNGSLMARDLEKPSGTLEMWQWHDGKVALEHLWRTGELAIEARRGFQKVYNLPERCVPSEYFGHQVSEDTFIDWACRSALDRLGFGSPGDIARFWDLLTIDEVKAWITRMDGQAYRMIEVCGLDDKPKLMVARPDIEDVVDALTAMPARVRALSPFDPVIRDRKRLFWLWGFDYRIEIYVPAAKRQWGYYIFPLLDGDQLIGRIDMKADRKDDCLSVKELWMEDRVRLSRARGERLYQELSRIARFCGVSDIRGHHVIDDMTG